MSSRRHIRSGRRSPSWLGTLIEVSLRTLTFPLRAMLAIRRAMTPASITLLLIGIVSANIIWGYPWIGVFSACSSLFLVGFLLNRSSLPALESEFILPRLGVAGQPFQAQTILVNPSRLPAMELQVELKPRRHLTWQNPVRFEVDLPENCIPMIHPGDRVRLNTTLVCQSRGLHRLPDVSVTSWFPFHLFRHIRRIKTDSTIAITPRILTDNEDSFSGSLLDALGDWTRKLLAGDAMDYTGSREYQPGMTVRRWDFPSWARLGQPIVREYQSPSVRSILLIIDTAVQSSAHPTTVSADDQTLEHILSLAATAIEQVCRSPIHIRMLVTGQDQGADQELGSERETLLIRLAMANRQPPQEADIEIADWCRQLDHQPVLILTSRCEPAGPEPLPANATVLRVDPAHAKAPAIHNIEHQLATPEPELTSTGKR